MARLTQNWKQTLDQNLFVITALFISKAFPCIPHDIMNAKPHSCRWIEDTGTFVNSFLKCRKQNVKVEDIYSPFEVLLSEVPLWSILRRILFNILLSNLLFLFERSKAFIILLMIARYQRYLGSKIEKRISKLDPSSWIWKMEMETSAVLSTLILTVVLYFRILPFRNPWTKLKKKHQHCLRILLNENVCDYKILSAISGKCSIETKRLSILATEIFKTANLSWKMFLHQKQMPKDVPIILP